MTRFRAASVAALVALIGACAPAGSASPSSIPASSTPTSSPSPAVTPSPTSSDAARIETGGGIPLVAFDDLIWGARPDELWTIDPATNAIAPRVPLVGLIEILDLDVAPDEVWIAARRAGRIGTVVRLDLRTEQVVEEFRVSLPAGVAIAPHVAWVTSNETDELVGFAR